MIDALFWYTGLVASEALCPRGSEHTPWVEI
jgi:hypothetical protein